MSNSNPVTRLYKTLKLQPAAVSFSVDVSSDTISKAFSSTHTLTAPFSPKSEFNISRTCPAKPWDPAVYGDDYRFTPPRYVNPSPSGLFRPFLLLIKIAKFKHTHIVVSLLITHTRRYGIVCVCNRQIDIASRSLLLTCCYHCMETLCVLIYAGDYSGRRAYKRARSASPGPHLEPSLLVS